MKTAFIQHITRSRAQGNYHLQGLKKICETVQPNWRDENKRKKSQTKQSMNRQWTCVCTCFYREKKKREFKGGSIGMRFFFSQKRLGPLVIQGREGRLRSGRGSGGSGGGIDCVFRPSLCVCEPCAVPNPQSIHTQKEKVKWPSTTTTMSTPHPRFAPFFFLSTIINQCFMPCGLKYLIKPLINKNRWQNNQGFWLEICKHKPNYHNCFS